MDDTQEPRGADWVGRVLDGRYQVESVIAKGGMGLTFLASDQRQFGRRVAIKIPYGDILATRTFRDRFTQEVKQLVAREHPHIVRLYDSGELEGIPYAVMQYLPGGSLRNRMETGSVLSVANVMQWLPGIAAALDFIHGEVLHRDVKPENILFDAEGHAYLADFGIAKVFADPMLVTRKGNLLGSPPYMAPEAAAGKRVTPAYDQYALAVVVFEALAGQRPFREDFDDDVTYLMQKLTVAPRSLRDLQPRVPAPAADAVMKALSTDPRHRYRSCRDFATAFEGHRASAARWPIAATAAASIVVAAVWSFSSRDRNGAPEPATTSIPAAVANPPGLESQWTGFQARMEQAHATILLDDGAPRTAPAQKAERWRGFLADFSADNPTTAADEILRASARERLQEWERQLVVATPNAPKAVVSVASTPRATPPQPAVHEPPPTAAPGPSAPAAPVSPSVERDSRPPAEPEPRRANAEAIREPLARASQLFDRADYEGAVRAYEAVLALDPENVAARQGLDRARRAEEAESRVLRRLKDDN